MARNSLLLQRRSYHTHIYQAQQFFLSFWEAFEITGRLSFAHVPSHNNFLAPIEARPSKIYYKLCLMSLPDR